MVVQNAEISPFRSGRSFISELRGSGASKRFYKILTEIKRKKLQRGFKREVLIIADKKIEL